jgi:alpha-D-ribose 1-methylphosphonate 5-triphosphate synthase subunit PhnL
LFIFLETTDVQNLLNQKGPNSFYESVKTGKSVVLFGRSGPVNEGFKRKFYLDYRTKSRAIRKQE